METQILARIHFTNESTVVEIIARVNLIELLSKISDKVIII